MPRLPDEEETERIRGYGLGDSFRPVLSGSVGVTRQEILRFFRVADLFVLPSFLEGLPISLLEAMSLGIPSISTNVNAIPEAIIDGETGDLIQRGDTDALSRGIISLKEDSAMSKRIADTGREFVLKNFDERIAAEKALEMYKKALGMSERDVDIPKG
jgi:N,N'-diacetylbacillosaminyl-diphospho-undecaprenol alpha-1,3-N-acetylgalactosaminyltransferase